jgi:hypothetical protein
MPNLGAGVDQHVNTNPVPTWVFTPNPVGGAAVRLYNEGSQVVYIGGANVSPYNGLPLYPGSRPLELQNANSTVYSCSNVTGLTSVATLSAALNAGVSAFTTASSIATIANGATIVLGPSGAGQEVVTVTGSTGGTAYTVSTATLYDHKTGGAVYTAVSTPGQLRVTAGVV